VSMGSEHDPASTVPRYAAAPPSEGQSGGRSSSGALIGKVLGRNYRVLEFIGAGSMGKVFVVEHITLKKQFAAKLLTAELARHPQAVARFETEAHAASRLDHENIVSIIDFGKTDDGTVFIIMELLRGMTLQARMDQGPLSIDEVVGIVLQVCQALAAAHSAGIVHRDMKPDNIFLCRRPGSVPLVKVLDFGIAKARENSLREGRITIQGQLLGSPEYMSPEASRGRDVDPRADTYAIGILLYELLCGQVPFRHDNSLEVLHMHAYQQPRPPRELAPDLPLALERLILRALEKDPARRPPSIQNVQLDLMAALPEVAHRVLLQTHPAFRFDLLPRASRSMPAVRGTNPPIAEARALPYAPPAPGHETTLDLRLRFQRRLLIAMWSAAAIMAAIAVVLFLIRRPDASHLGQAARPPEIRLRIASSPPGAIASLDGARLGRTPLDAWLPAVLADGKIEIELPGYEPAARWVRLDRDREIHLSLYPDRDAESSGSASSSDRQDREKQKDEEKDQDREKERSKRKRSSGSDRDDDRVKIKSGR
jgi:serine/threonine protein kinase